jgi:hypothetical protein
MPLTNAHEHIFFADRVNADTSRFREPTERRINFVEPIIRERIERVQIVWRDQVPKLRVEVYLVQKLWDAAENDDNRPVSVLHEGLDGIDHLFRFVDAKCLKHVLALIDMQRAMVEFG